MAQNKLAFLLKCTQVLQPKRINEHQIWSVINQMVGTIGGWSSKLIISTIWTSLHGSGWKISLKNSVMKYCTSIHIKSTLIHIEAQSINWNLYILMLIPCLCKSCTWSMFRFLISRQPTNMVFMFKQWKQFKTQIQIISNSPRKII